MSGSLEDAEDLVQETLLRAWRARGDFEGRASFRAWLYRIATNACLDLLARRPPRVLPPDVVGAADPALEPPASTDAPWLEPYPGRLLEALRNEEQPGARVEDRETIELAFLAAIQHLPPRRRAVIILRDVLEFSAKDSAAVLSMSVASVNSTLQRARRALGQRLAPRRIDWERPREASAEERALLRLYMEAHESGPPLRRSPHCCTRTRGSRRRPGRSGTTGATRCWRRPAGSPPPTASATSPPAPTASPRPRAICALTARRYSGRWGVDVLRIEDGLVAEVTVFLRPDLFEAFGLPPSLR